MELDDLILDDLINLAVTRGLVRAYDFSNDAVYLDMPDGAAILRYVHAGPFLRKKLLAGSPAAYLPDEDSMNPPSTFC